MNGEINFRRQISAIEPVLLAEDNEEEILWLYEAFKRVEIENPLFVVYDGRHAIEYLGGTGKFQDREKYPIPCLMLLSTDLAEKSGLEVLKWVRQEGNPLRLLPVIMLASSVRGEELKKALALGANDYVPKFFNLHEVLEWARSLKSSWLELGSIYGALMAFLV